MDDVEDNSEEQVTAEDLLAICAHLCRLGGWEQVAALITDGAGQDQLAGAAEELRWSGDERHRDAHWQLALAIDELAGQRRAPVWDDGTEVSLPHAEGLVVQAAREIDGAGDVAAVLCAEGTPAGRALSIAELLDR